MPDGTLVNKKTTVPLQDAQRAIYLVRENADTWGVQEHKLGILGSSAGGHLASTAATHYRKVVTENARQFSMRPDFLILNYPVISFADSLTHHGSRYNLIGALDGEAREKALASLPQAKEKLALLKVEPALVRAYSNELQVDSDTPPTFVTHAVDDDVVPVSNSLLFMAALQQHGVEVRSFIYARGGHGYGMDNPTATQDWFEPMVQWLLQLPFKALKK
jgi:acetyl esterase/lipase